MVFCRFKLFRNVETKRPLLIITLTPESGEYIPDGGFGRDVQTEVAIGYTIGTLMKDHTISHDEAEQVFETAIVVWDPTFRPKTDHD
jgi:hypothetical protein